MTRIEWAEREIEAAKKRERGDNPEDDGWDYGCACYDSALKAYKSLMEDGHSGMSFGITKNILIRLMNDIPLSPITDEDFENPTPNNFGQDWLDERGLISTQQCLRRGSLWRDTHKDGTVTYHDNERYYCQNIDNDWNTYTSKRSMKYLDKLFPITMPYTPPTKRYVIMTDDFLFDESQKRWNDWDTEAYFEIITPTGEHIPINEFYKDVYDGEEVVPAYEYETLSAEGDPVTHYVEEKVRPAFKTVEIDAKEYYARKEVVKNRS